MPSGKAKESRAFQSPSRYIQGPGELRNLPVQPIMAQLR